MCSIYSVYYVHIHHTTKVSEVAKCIHTCMCMQCFLLSYMTKHHVAKYIQWVLDYPNPDYPYPDIWTSADVGMFSVSAGKRPCCHWSFAKGESKAAARTTFPKATMLFHAVWDLDHDLQRPS